MNDIRMVEANAKYQRAKESLRLFAIGAVGAVMFVGYLVMFMVGRG